MTELEPETLYAYRVGSDGGLWSEWFQFRTASKEPKAFSFLYVGDAQHQIRDYFSRELRQAALDAPDARFIVHAGDLVTTGFSDMQWGEWHGAGGWLNAMIPSVPTVGNHEYYGGRASQVARRGAAHEPQSLDDGGVPLSGVLGVEPERANAMQTHWKPLFDKYGVDLVLQGHEHLYGRLRVAEGELPAKNAPGAERRFDAARGTVYVTSVGVAMLLKMDPSARELMMRTGENLQLYQIITVDGARVRYQAKTVTGRIYDAFELVKQGPRQPNTLIEHPKDMAPHYFETAAPLQGMPAFTLTSEQFDRYVDTYSRSDYSLAGTTTVLDRVPARDEANSPSSR
jgi:Purple acid Phosphatase, N-terminal domain/Calcineurin-like phosphoesterase